MLLLPYLQPFFAIRSGHHLVSTYHILQSTTNNITKIGIIFHQQQFYHIIFLLKKYLFLLPTRQKKKKIHYTPLQCFLHTLFHHALQPRGKHNSNPIRSLTHRLYGCGRQPKHARTSRKYDSVLQRNTYAVISYLYQIKVIVLTQG